MVLVPSVWRFQGRWMKERIFLGSKWQDFILWLVLQRPWVGQEANKEVKELIWMLLGETWTSHCLRHYMKSRWRPNIHEDQLIILYHKISMQEIKSPPFNWIRTRILLNVPPFHYCMKIGADQFERTHPYFSCKYINPPDEVGLHKTLNTAKLCKCEQIISII